MGTYVNTSVAGIPCTVEVLTYLNVPGSHSYHAASDLDYYGYSEVEWTLCDRRGRPAPWLERKLTPADEDRILQDIDDHYTQLQDNYDDYDRDDIR